MLIEDIERVFQRHDRVALQFSGGRDSLAVLHLLRPFWDRITVYHLNSGDAFPDTLDLIERTRALVPNFVEVAGRQPTVHAAHGWPSDIVGTGNTGFGIMMASGTGLRLIDRYECCFRSIMQPMHERMTADGVTLIIRGQRDSDAAKPPLKSGAVSDGIEVLYPIELWSDDQVMNFLADSGLPIPRYYLDGMPSAPDCMHCTGWLEHKVAGYLAKHYPDVHQEVNRRLKQIRISIAPVIRALNHTIEGDRP